MKGSTSRHIEMCQLFRNTNATVLALCTFLQWFPLSYIYGSLLPRQSETSRVLLFLFVYYNNGPKAMLSQRRHLRNSLTFRVFRNGKQISGVFLQALIRLRIVCLLWKIKVVRIRVSFLDTTSRPPAENYGHRSATDEFFCMSLA